ncbi:MAG: tetratricopeptide repeat protein [Nitrospirota bacterium]
MTEMAGKKKQYTEEIETHQTITYSDIKEVVKNFENNFATYDGKDKTPLEIIREILSVYRAHNEKSQNKNINLNTEKFRPIIRRRDLIKMYAGGKEPDSAMKKEFAGLKKQINDKLRELMFKKEKNKSLNPKGLILKKSKQSRTGEGETSNYFVSIAIPEKSPLEVEKKKPSEARSKIKLAQELSMPGWKHPETIQAMKEALSIARVNGNEEEEVEILLRLVLLSSVPCGRDDLQYYFKEAEKIVGKLKTNAVKAMYFRARALVLETNRDLSGAEEAYKAALNCCLNEPAEDEENNLADQGCAARSSYVHLLCNQKKLEEAGPLLAECEEYARLNKDAEDGELFKVALEAGIHFSLESGNEDGAIQRIAELEQFASTPRLAYRIGGDLLNVSNDASWRQAHRAALAAAATSVRLGQRCYDGVSPSIIVGALYAEAMVLAEAGDDEKALGKAEAVLEICNRPEDATTKQLTHQLIAEIRQRLGDSQAAVDLAQLALNAAKGSLIDVAFTKSSLAPVLNDNGQTEAALKEAREAWILTRSSNVSVFSRAKFLSQITEYASQLGLEKDVAEALGELEQIPDEHEKVKAQKTWAIECASGYRELRQRFMYVINESEPAKIAGTAQCVSLQEANKLVFKPLLRLWREMPESATEAYDFWGRGNFERLLLNARHFHDSFNVTIKVRSLEDVKKAIRLWGIYADFLILLWKGKTNNVLAIAPFPEDYAYPGGWGYEVDFGSVLKKKGSKKKWHPAKSSGSSLLPIEVINFLTTEALPFIQSGRLIVVPALGVGCINPGHGPLEQLLEKAANAIPNIRWKGFEERPIGFVPYSPDAPLDLLAELAEAELANLQKLRLLLLNWSRELKPDDDRDTTMLSLEIGRALRELEEKNVKFANKKGLEKAKELLTGTTAQFRLNSKKLAGIIPDSPYTPFFILKSLGYRWQVDGLQALRLTSRFGLQEGDVIGTWIAPRERDEINQPQNKKPISPDFC